MKSNQKGFRGKRKRKHCTAILGLPGPMHELRLSAPRMVDTEQPQVRQRSMEKPGSERNRHEATAQNIAQHHDEFMLPKLNYSTVGASSATIAPLLHKT
jgi:hypothetical protein